MYVYGNDTVKSVGHYHEIIPDRVISPVLDDPTLFHLLLGYLPHK